MHFAVEHFPLAITLSVTRSFALIYCPPSDF